MSLIVTYISTRGCVIIGDKRRIAYFGDRSAREKLEEELYSGRIKSDEELQRRASELGLNIKVTDDACKVRSIGDVVVGEISQKTPFETKRRRIYATTGAYQIIELTGSRITSMEKGDTAIIVFGNRIAKEITNGFLKRGGRPGQPSRKFQSFSPSSWSMFHQGHHRSEANMTFS